MNNQQIRQLYNSGKTINQLIQLSGLAKCKVISIVKGRWLMLKLHVTVSKAANETESFEYPFKYENYIDAAQELERASYILGKSGESIKSVTIEKE